MQRPCPSHMLNHANMISPKEANVRKSQHLQITNGVDTFVSPTDPPSLFISIPPTQRLACKGSTVSIFGQFCVRWIQEPLAGEHLRDDSGAILK